MDMTTMTEHAPGTHDAVAAWTAALDALEQDLAETEALLDGAREELAPIALRRAASWRVPRGLGTLPPSLVERAGTVLEAQRRTATRIARAMSQTRAQVRVLDAADPVEHGRPVYLDAEG